MIEAVYLHYPFCLKKCGYCSFFSLIETPGTRAGYLDYLIKEINKYLPALAVEPRTIYFGGGTPSLMNGEEVRRIANNFDLSSLLEFTLEANPATLSKAKLQAYRDSSINRLSIGMQSFKDEELRFLRRLHSSADNYLAFDLARDCGFDNISVDLIYGLPGQTKQDLLSNLEQIIKLNPEHISTYCLSLEEDTPLARGGVKLPSDEITAEFYRCIGEKLLDAGYEHYEISNFARKGFMSGHNLAYWLNREYIGFGAGAHSFVGDLRYSNADDLASYYSTVKSSELFPNNEIQDSSLRRKDLVIQSLRLKRGLELKEYNELFSDDFLTRYQKSIAKHWKFLEIRDGFMSLTAEGFFVSNEIIVDFID